jgi:hypothetical protein
MLSNSRQVSTVKVIAPQRAVAPQWVSCGGKRRLCKAAAGRVSIPLLADRAQLTYFKGPIKAKLVQNQRSAGITRGQIVMAQIEETPLRNLTWTML